MVKGDEVVDSLSEERVPLLCKHEVIGDADRNSLGQNDGEYQERIQRPRATDIKVKVYPAVVIKNEITNSICSLNRIRVTVKRVKEPGIVLRDKLAGASVGPEHVIAV